MADIYVRSTDGSDSDDGSTWSLAKATMTGAAAIDSAGDSIYLSNNHAESTASSLTFTLAGTVTAPTKIICGDDSTGEPPTTPATTASITTTGASNISCACGFAYWQGIIFEVGTGASAAAINLNSALTAGFTHWKDCSFRLNTSHGSSNINPHSILAGVTVWENCSVKFGGAAQKVNLSSGGGRLLWRGGSLLSGGTSPNAIFFNASTGFTAIIEAVDFSNGDATLDLVDPGSAANCLTIFRECKLPASWSGDAIYAALPSGGRVEMYNCANSDVNYALKISDYTGTIDHETTLVKTGGASDGTTPLSWKCISNTNAVYPNSYLETSEIISEWNDTVGSSVTVTVDILHDSATALQDDEIWVDVLYLGTSGVPLGLLVSDRTTGALASSTDQDSSGATWTTTGMSNPNKQKLVVTFTPQEAGVFVCRVRIGKPSYTLYIDPVAQIS